MDAYRYVYLLMVGVVFLLWLAIFLIRKDLRKEMLVMTGVISVLGISETLYVGEYWTPHYAFPFFGPLVGVEDFLLTAFFYGGVGSVLYQYISKQKYLCAPHSHSRRCVFGCSLAAGAGLAAFLILERATSLNIIYTTSIPMLAAACIVALFHPYLLKTIVLNGLLMAALAVLILATFNTVFPGFIVHTWNLNALSGLLFGSVPAEELLFNFSAGACFAVIYECLFNCKPLMKGRRAVAL